MMLKAVSDRLAYRIGPELTKVFAFDRQFTFDSHVVLSYSAEGRHFFGAHRDNGAPTTADRAFAVSLNLNDDFAGGELVFPEYAGVRVSPPAGGAAVVSCSLLHPVLPLCRLMLQINGEGDRPQGNVESGFVLHTITYDQVDPQTAGACTKAGQHIG